MSKFAPNLSALQKYDRRFIWKTIASLTFSLCAILVFQLVGYYIQKVQIDKERETAIVVSASANQRMLSQRLALLSMALMEVESESIRERAKNALLSELSNMEKTHQALIAGDPVMGIRGEKSQEIRQIFFSEPVALDRKVREFITTARALTEVPATELNSLNPKLFKLTEMSTELLELFEKLTSQYRDEGIERIQGLKQAAAHLLIAAIGLLVCTGLFIFYPIVHRLKIEFYERTSAQSELVEQNKELEQFAATVAHDLKAPLNNIGGFSKFLRSKLVTNEDQEGIGILDSIEAGVTRMTKMINELLQYARITRSDLKIEKVSLNSIIEKVKKDFEKTIIDEKARLRIESFPSIIGNKVQLEHLFSNLIGNALKYRHPDRAPDIQIRVIANKNDDLLTFFVEDNGRGFPVGAEERMFQPFRRLNKDEAVEGSGFGLALCQKVAKRHNGSISAERVESGGARFVVTLTR